jgi:phospholipid transport system substrate-binding protein
MNYLLLALLLFTFQLKAEEVLHKEIDSKNPFLMVEQISEHIFIRLQNESVAIKKDPNMLKNIIREEIMPHFNHRYAAAKVLGNVHFKKLSKDQFLEFSRIFKNYVITSYAQIFTLYENQKVKYQPTGKFENKKILTVSMEILSDVRPPVNITFMLKINRQTQEWKVFDLIAEGVSFLDSKRVELGKLFNKKGVKATSLILKEKSLATIKFSNSTP